MVWYFGSNLMQTVVLPNGGYQLLDMVPQACGGDLNRNFPIEAFETIEQLVGSEAAEMAVHQMRRFRLLDAEQRSNFTLFEFPVFQQLIDAKSKP